ncbi:GTP cyclohydrolase II [Brevibacillus humidisoli]|uniref:GTP cyclohydrolase II n=1 Tax=Brevibacillus humidisoli TaxID=2895522 RepID=UPI001E55B7B8|nr:GTP cyclohydrolase II [Brevibacillus humidisoli]UFJ43133.1 GTP cyclohydrolase II [Brevibacillus humidisoli]
MLTKSSLYNVLLSRWQVIKDGDGEIVYLFGPNQMPIKIDDQTHVFQWFTWLKAENLPENIEEFLDALPEQDLSRLQYSSLLTYGDFSGAEEAKIRLHSICHTGDIFGSQRCDCGSQFREALKRIVAFGAGGLFYLADHEGRGIGLFSKALTYALQEEGLDTAEANKALGLAIDQRSYHEAVLVLKWLRNKPIILLSNNPDKVQFLSDGGVFVSGVEPLMGEVSEYNHFYLATKADVFLRDIKLPEKIVNKKGWAL